MRTHEKSRKERDLPERQRMCQSQQRNKALKRIAQGKGFISLDKIARNHLVAIQKEEF